MGGGCGRVSIQACDEPGTTFTVRRAEGVGFAAMATLLRLEKTIHGLPSQRDGESAS